jgi:hypothetical protein
LGVYAAQSFDEAQALLQLFQPLPAEAARALAPPPSAALAETACLLADSQLIALIGLAAIVELVADFTMVQLKVLCLNVADRARSKSILICPC